MMWDYSRSVWKIKLALVLLAIAKIFATDVGDESGDYGDDEFSDSFPGTPMPTFAIDHGSFGDALPVPEMVFAKDDVCEYFDYLLRVFVFRATIPEPQPPTNMPALGVREAVPFAFILQYGHWNDWREPLPEIFRKYIGSEARFEELERLTRKVSKQPLASYIPDVIRRQLDNLPREQIVDLFQDAPVPRIIDLTIRLPFVTEVFKIQTSNHSTVSDFLNVVSELLDGQLEFKLCIGKNYFYNVALKIWELGGQDGSEVLVFMSDLPEKFLSTPLPDPRQTNTVV